ncbi:formylglycine-generating enzyme family protein [Labrys wisconsinensis]|uniref:Formylglycine-generating enzyme required for sulfatase activity n=1 Tax=Labrys wisconsinensis TaxID=425677 RepID=A0ABU0JKG9_9HYPH|nr:formylglycine-generating enzyme family protein [Labrys wisconsinensis]MDQ0473627.1 formylglycine-generating enzyme required for sulfatase activity [Labrys wisconsinensis]
MSTIARPLLRGLALAALLACAGPASAAEGPRAPASEAGPVQIFPPGFTPLTPEREQALKPRDSFRECEHCPEMVVVPPGKFVMGTPANEPDADADEHPQHAVTIPAAFAVGRFAVTFDEWDACAAAGACPAKPDDRGFGRGRRPVIDVNWDEAKTYLAWLSRTAGRTYRLPTEAEREYFARAGTRTPFWFGRTISPAQANYKASIPYGSGPRGEDSTGTLPVDSFRPNRFGLYQVHGNIWEWTEDCYKKTYVEVPADGSPMREGKCDERVRRGGAWSDVPWFLRSGKRWNTKPFTGGPDIGFRVVRDLPAAGAPG